MLLNKYRVLYPVKYIVGIMIHQINFWHFIYNQSYCRVLFDVGYSFIHVPFVSISRSHKQFYMPLNKLWGSYVPSKIVILHADR